MFYLCLTFVFYWCYGFLFYEHAKVTKAQTQSVEANIKT